MVGVHFTGRKLNSDFFEIEDAERYACRGMISPVLRTTQYQVLCWRRRCEAIALTGSVQHKTVAALRSNEKVSARIVC